MSETGGITPAKWVARQGKNHLKDKDYLRTMTTDLLRKVLSNTRRSIIELDEYVVAIESVLSERES